MEQIDSISKRNASHSIVERLLRLYLHDMSIIHKSIESLIIRFRFTYIVDPTVI